MHGAQIKTAERKETLPKLQTVSVDVCYYADKTEPAVTRISRAEQFQPPTFGHRFSIGSVRLTLNSNKRDLWTSYFFRLYFSSEAGRRFRFDTLHFVRAQIISSARFLSAWTVALFSSAPRINVFAGAEQRARQPFIGTSAGLFSFHRRWNSLSAFIPIARRSPSKRFQHPDGTRRVPTSFPGRVSYFSAQAPFDL